MRDEQDYEDIYNYLGILPIFLPLPCNYPTHTCPIPNGIDLIQCIECRIAFALDGNLMILALKELKKRDEINPFLWYASEFYKLYCINNSLPESENSLDYIWLFSEPSNFFFILQQALNAKVIGVIGGLQ